MLGTTQDGCRKKKNKCLLQGIWCPHIQQQPHLAHGCLPRLICEPPLGIPWPSSETLAITGQILGFRKAGEQMFSEPACRVGIRVWRKHVRLQDLCGPQHWSLASSYSISVCHACWSALKTSQKPAQLAPLAWASTSPVGTVSSRWPRWLASASWDAVGHRGTVGAVHAGTLSLDFKSWFYRLFASFVTKTYDFLWALKSSYIIEWSS